jgi:hypothetical protein
MLWEVTVLVKDKNHFDNIQALFLAEGDTEEIAKKNTLNENDFDGCLVVLITAVKHKGKTFYRGSELI